MQLCAFGVKIPIITLLPQRQLDFYGNFLGDETATLDIPYT